MTTAWLMLVAFICVVELFAWRRRAPRAVTQQLSDYKLFLEYARLCHSSNTNEAVRHLYQQRYPADVAGTIWGRCYTRPIIDLLARGGTLPKRGRIQLLTELHEKRAQLHKTTHPAC